MEIEPLWFMYATFDDDGFVNGIRDDAPEDVKKAYAEYEREKQREEAGKTPMAKY